MYKYMKIYYAIYPVGYEVPIMIALVNAAFWFKEKYLLEIVYKIIKALKIKKMSCSV